MQIYISVVCPLCLLCSGRYRTTPACIRGTCGRGAIWDLRQPREGKALSASCTRKNRFSIQYSIAKPTQTQITMSHALSYVA